MKQLNITCDRCGKPVPQYDEQMLDTLRADYPGEDICPDCDLEISLAAQLAKNDCRKGLKAGTTLKIMADLYGLTKHDPSS